MCTTTTIIFLSRQNIKSTPPIQIQIQIAVEHSPQMSENKTHIEWCQKQKQTLKNIIDNTPLQHNILTKAWLHDTEFKISSADFVSEENDEESLLSPRLNTSKHDERDAENMLKLYACFVNATILKKPCAVWDLYDFLRNYKEIENLDQLLKECVDKKHPLACDEYSRMLREKNDSRWVEYVIIVTPELLDYYYENTQFDRLKDAFDNLPNDFFKEEPALWWYYHALLTDAKKKCSKCDENQCPQTKKVLFEHVFGSNQRKSLSYERFPDQYVNAAVWLFSFKDFHALRVLTLLPTILEKLKEHLSTSSDEYIKACICHVFGMYNKRILYSRTQAINFFRQAIDHNNNNNSTDKKQQILYVTSCCELSELFYDDEDEDDDDDKKINIVPLKDLKVGDYLDCRDSVNNWCIAEVLKMTDMRIYVHYEGWSTRWDEWLGLTTDSVAPLHTYTKEKDWAVVKLRKKLNYC